MVLLAYLVTLAALCSSIEGKMKKCSRRTDRSSSKHTKLNASHRAAGSKETAWIPVDKWMLPDTWNKMGCSGFTSERACNEAIGLEKLQPLYEKHWSSFYSQEDFYEMKERGLNTVRIPLPYWTVESTIADDEPFARGSMHYVRQTVRWAKNASLRVILDLHGLPGRQTLESFSGDNTRAVSFFTNHNYDRAYEVLRNWTTLAHTDPDFSTVDVIEPVNEPKQGIQPGLLDVYYPQAQKVIRETEKSLGVTCGGSGKQCLTVQYMANSWGSGDPVPHIDTDDRFALDDHLYTQWIVAESQRTRQGYLDFLCTTTRTTGQGGPTIAGEWSLSTIGGGELETTSDGATEFFKKFAAAQIYAGEKGAGWIFWSWKTELESDTWDYRRAVKAGYLPSHISKIDKSVCDGY
ncbi:glycoside hydrolase family 5 protein [Sporobolomyces salmoneus]|uniref:glycoside hydrolase family 5 protein n=1 Tax=Sporobolomyces salmoneus TaxID=183962 RepID=UPI00317A19B8